MRLRLMYRVFQQDDEGRLVPVRLRHLSPREVLTDLYESPEAALAEADALVIGPTIGVEFLVIPVIVQQQP